MPRDVSRAIYVHRLLAAPLTAEETNDGGGRAGSSGDSSLQTSVRRCQEQISKQIRPRFAEVWSLPQ